MSAAGAVVLVTTSFPILGDGSEAAGGFVHDLAMELAKTAPVRIVAPGAVTMVEPLAEHVDVFRFASPGKPLSTLRPWVPWEILPTLRVLREGMRSTRSAVNAGPTALLVGLWALPSGEWARRAASEAGIPYQVWTLGSDIWVLGRIPIVRSLLRKVLRNAGHCFSDGLQLAADTQRISQRQVEFLPSTRAIASRRELLPRARPPYRLIFLGRWHPNKGVDLLVQALGRLSEDDWSRIESVDIHGGGHLQQWVREHVAALQAQGRPVTAGGYLSKERAEAAMRQADLLLIPSRIESIPVVFSDAMKLGLPVVSMPVGDLTELVADAPACGVLARDVSPEAFAAALSKALDSDLTVWSQGVFDRAERFDLGEVAQRLLLLRHEARNE